MNTFKVLCDFCLVENCPLRRKDNCALFVEKIKSSKGKVYPITPEQVDELRYLFYPAEDPTSGSLEAKIMIQKKINDKLEEIFPEEFKPEQKYCCTFFENRVKEGSIFKVLNVGWRAKTVDGPWLLNYCLNCGLKPKPPVKE